MGTTLASVSLENAYHTVRERIAAACAAAQRDPATVHLIAVSKTHDLSAIQALQRLGQRCFGENYVREFSDKYDAFKLAPEQQAINWHFIGALQANKTRAVAERADWVHSIDRLRIAERLSAQRPAERGPLQVCLQVDLSHEPGKSGVIEAELPELARAVAVLPGLELRGLMALPAPTEELALQREPFARLRELRDNLNRQLGLELDVLSMGMSDDLEAAIFEGATHIRIGTALFGARPYPEPA